MISFRFTPDRNWRPIVQTFPIYPAAHAMLGYPTEKPVKIYDYQRRRLAQTKTFALGKWGQRYAGVSPCNCSQHFSILKQSEKTNKNKKAKGST